MTKTVVIVGALDTKGEEFAYTKGIIEKLGVKTLLVDFGVMGKPAIAPDVTREEVAKAGGGDLNYLASGSHKDEAMKTMAKGLAVVVRNCMMRASWTASLGWAAAAAPRSPPGPCGLCRWACPR